MEHPLLRVSIPIQLHALVLAGAALAVVADGAPAADGVLLDACETPDRWHSVGEPYGNVELSTGYFDAKEGGKCLRMGFGGGNISYVRFSAPHSWGDRRLAYLSFWLRAEKKAEGDWKLRVGTDSSDGVFTINRFIDLDFDGWRRVRLARSDFEFIYRKPGAPIDWGKVNRFTFGQMGGVPMPDIYIDDVRFEPGTTSAEGKAAETVVVSRCESADKWAVTGLDVGALPGFAMEGENALQLAYKGVAKGRLAKTLDGERIGPHHALAFGLRGPGVSTKARFTAVLSTPAGGRFEKTVTVAGFEMRQYMLFPNEFRKIPAADGTVPAWQEISEVAFLLDSPNANEVGEIILDNVYFKRMAPAKRRVVPDKKFWWWDGGYDPFCMMHAVHADWPHLQSDARGAVLKFSEFLLSPLMPYTIYLHNDGRYRSFRVTITDWQTNVQRVLTIDSPAGGVVSRDLVAPAEVGTQLLNVDCLDAAGQVVKHYQTGTIVLAKRLKEPEGVWGMHAFVGGKGRSWPHHQQVMRIFQAVGVMVMRERIPFIKDPAYQAKLVAGSQGRVARMAKELGIKVVTSTHLHSTRKLWAEHRGIAPGMEGEMEATMATITKAWKGVIDIWEIGNEDNSDGTLAPYAESLAVIYRGAKKGNPHCQVGMGGAHVLNNPKAWQLALWETEKETGVQRQDFLTTHLYPDPASVESSLRPWIRSLGPALVEKGMIMTEGGWETFPLKDQALMRQGLLPEGHSGERIVQDWYARYANVILGEHLAMGAKLKGVCYFLAMGAMGDWMWDEGRDLSGELRNSGLFAAKWNDRQITVGRPMIYTHNTIARLLTHEVVPASVPVIYDKAVGKVENYAFHRPGETIVALWVGVGAGSRADEIEAIVEVPAGAAIALAVDLNGNERELIPAGSFVAVKLRNESPQYLRFLDGERVDDVFVQGMSGYDADFKVAAGVPAANGAIIAGVAADRDLPTLSDVVPLPDRPMVLVSPAQQTVYVVGQSNADVVKATEVLNGWRK